MRRVAIETVRGARSVTRLARLLAFLLSLIAIVAASRADAFVAPERPSGLPRAAVFAGGADGGDWVSCNPDPDNVIHCVVYWPETGQPRYESWYRFCSMLTGGGHMRPANARPASLIGIGAVFEEVPFFFDRPSRFIPQPGTSREEAAEQRQINRDYYERFGVTQDCRPSSDNTELVRHVHGEQR